jgi:hypothetical protein
MRNKIMLSILLIIIIAIIVILLIVSKPYPLDYWLSKYINENEITKISLTITPLHGDEVHCFSNDRSDIIAAWKGINEISEIKRALDRPSMFSFAPDYYMIISDNSGSVSITPMLSRDNKTYYIFVRATKNSNPEKPKELLLKTSMDVFSLLEALTSSLPPIDASYEKSEENDRDKQLRASTSYAFAESLLQIVQKETITDTEKYTVFSSLSDLNWEALDLYDRDNRTTLSDNACFMLFQWLNSVVPEMNEEEMLAVMQATQGLDGAYSESFAGLMVQIFDRDRIAFFQILSKIEHIKNAEQTINFLTYGCSYKNDEEAKQIYWVLKDYITSSEPSTNEKHLINLFLDTLPKETDAWQYVSADLGAKLSAGLADPNPIASFAWSLIKHDIKVRGQVSNVFFLDAEIMRLECTDSFSEFYDDRVIEAYALEYRLKPEDVSKIGLVGFTEIDDDGWLYDTISMGHPWLITERQGDTLSVIGGSHPMGEGRGVPLSTLDILMNRDLELGLNIAKLVLASLEYSIAPYAIYSDNQPSVFFQIPELCPKLYEWDISITGTLPEKNETIQLDVLQLGGDYKNTRWEPGGSYAVVVGKVKYSALSISVSLWGPGWEPINLVIDILPCIDK